MAFLGLMWVREHQMLMAVMKADMDDQRTRFRKEAHDDREMIARLGSQKVKHLTAIAGLQREVDGLRADVRQAEAAHDKAAAELATLKAERDDCQVQKDEGATYVLKSLADALHVEDWSIKDGSEEWEGDVFATMFSILVDAGVVEEDHHTVATHAKIIGLERAISSITPDALKYRERLRRDREALAAKRKRAVAALPNAQAARGGDVREGV